MATLKAKNPYIFFILVILSSFLIFSIWSAQQASIHGSEISDKNYYSKGLKYNNSRVEEQAAIGMGWALATKIDRNFLRFTLTDAKQQPVTQATAELTLFLAAENQIMALQLVESQPGHYELQLPGTLSGSLQARIDFEKQGARISRQLLVNL